MKLASLAGRLLFSLVFLTSGLSHFSAATIGYAAAQGVPFANVAVPLSGSIALAGALSIILGYKARIGAVLIIVFLIPISLVMHAFWNVADPMMHQMQMIMFMKNVSMLGGALFIMVHGSGPWSLDSTRGATAHAHDDTFSQSHATHIL
jgi:putative oxidoreductase